jgi:hypothetical protein
LPFFCRNTFFYIPSSRNGSKASLDFEGIDSDFYLKYFDKVLLRVELWVKQAEGIFPVREMMRGSVPVQ